MKTFTFKIAQKGEVETDDQYWNNVETVKSMSYKKAVKSYQNKHPELKMVGVYHPNKKGETLLTWQKLPIGRKKKIGQ